MHAKAMIVLATALGALLLASCSAGPLLQSAPVNAGRSQPVCGTSYYLPKKLLTLEVYEVMVAADRTITDPDGSQRVVADSASHFFAVFGPELLIPDHRHQFVIQRNESIASHEIVNISLTSDGLLSSVSGVVKDETGTAVAGLAHLARLIVKNTVGFGEYNRTRGLDVLDQPPSLVARYEFDPVDPKDYARVHDALASRGITMDIELQANCPTATSGADCATTCESTQPGIYYRLPLPYRITLYPAGEPTAQGGPVAVEAAFDRTLLLPNEAICKYVPVTRASFVEKQTTLTFESGMLSQVNTVKPSELVGFISIPIDVATELVGIPADLLTIRVNTTSQANTIAQNQTGLVNQEAQRLQSLTQLMEAIRQYEEAKQTQNR